LSGNFAAFGIEEPEFEIAVTASFSGSLAAIEVSGHGTRAASHVIVGSYTSGNVQQFFQSRSLHSRIVVRLCDRHGQNHDQSNYCHGNPIPYENFEIEVTHQG
jgi:hypothetical protein